MYLKGKGPRIQGAKGSREIMEGTTGKVAPVKQKKVLPRVN